MNSVDIAELKSRITMKECSFTRIRGALVNSEKDIITRKNMRFLRKSKITWKQTGSS